mmetsp:Transcript_18987/g.45853  ORF Transcript_18987/g.45853 Transcript_18987/m.45853 type:complete len:226 (+) Transcript_18987:1399-2076(+)
MRSINFSVHFVVVELPPELLVGSGSLVCSHVPSFVMNTIFEGLSKAVSICLEVAALRSLPSDTLSALAYGESLGRKYCMIDINVDGIEWYRDSIDNFLPLLPLLLQNLKTEYATAKDKRPARTLRLLLLLLVATFFCCSLSSFSSSLSLLSQPRPLLLPPSTVLPITMEYSCRTIHSFLEPFSGECRCFSVDAAVVIVSESDSSLLRLVLCDPPLPSSGAGVMVG